MFIGKPENATIMKIKEKKPKQCTKCKEKLIPFQYEVKKTNKNKKVKLMGKKCIECGMSYFDFYSYCNYSYAFSITNREHIESDLRLFDKKDDIEISDEIETTVNSFKSDGLDLQTYILPSNGGKICRNCGGELYSAVENVKGINCTPKKLTVKKCIKCGKNHISYGHYLQHSSNCKILPLNEDELLKISNAYENKREHKKECKEKQKQKKKEQRQKEKERLLIQQTNKMRTQSLSTRQLNLNQFSRNPVSFS